MEKLEIESGTANALGTTIMPRLSNLMYDSPTCVMCGCTDVRPCFDGEQTCFWVTMNSNSNAGLCSECIGF